MQAATVAEKFRDYWIGVPGARGTKLDWPATWRNFVRTEHAPQTRITRISPAAKQREDVMASLTGRKKSEVIDVESVHVGRIG